MYPYCELADVNRLRKQRPAAASDSIFGATEQTDVTQTWANYLRSVIIQAGYDADSVYENSSTVALAITAGSAVVLTVADGTQFAKGDKIKIEGLTSGVQNVEFDYLTAVSGNTITVATISNNYDASSATVYVVNEAMKILQQLNALAAAAEIEESLHMGISPNESKHAEKLWARFWGSEDMPMGIWAIQNIEGYLEGATTTSDAVEDITIQSYGSEHQYDDDIEPLFGIDDES